MVAIGLELAALGCGALTYLNRDHPELEGVYFNAPLRADEIDDLTESWFDPFDFGNPYLWLGLSVAFALSGIVVFVVSRRRSAGHPGASRR